MHVAEIGKDHLFFSFMASPNSGPRGFTKLITGLHIVTLSSHQTCEVMGSQTVRRIHLRTPLVLNIVGDLNIGLLNELGEDWAFVVGHDWGAEVAGHLCLFRHLSADWELIGPWQGVKIAVPTKFIVGDKDEEFVSFGTKDNINGEIFKEFVPNVEVVVIDGHHFIQLEKAGPVSNEISSFFQYSNHFFDE